MALLTTPTHLRLPGTTPTTAPAMEEQPQPLAPQAGPHPPVEHTIATHSPTLLRLTTQTMAAATMRQMRTQPTSSSSNSTIVVALMLDHMVRLMGLGMSCRGEEVKLLRLRRRGMALHRVVGSRTHEVRAFMMRGRGCRLETQSTTSTWERDARHQGHHHHQNHLIIPQQQAHTTQKASRCRCRSNQPTFARPPIIITSRSDDGHLHRHIHDLASPPWTSPFTTLLWRRTPLLPR